MTDSSKTEHNDLILEIVSQAEGETSIGQLMTDAEVGGVDDAACWQAIEELLDRGMLMMNYPLDQADEDALVWASNWKNFRTLSSEVDAAMGKPLLIEDHSNGQIRTYLLLCVDEDPDEPIEICPDETPRHAERDRANGAAGPFPRGQLYPFEEMVLVAQFSPEGVLLSRHVEVRRVPYAAHAWRAAGDWPKDIMSGAPSARPPSFSATAS